MTLTSSQTSVTGVEDGNGIAWTTITVTITQSGGNQQWPAYTGWRYWPQSTGVVQPSPNHDEYLSSHSGGRVSQSWYDGNTYLGTVCGTDVLTTLPTYSSILGRLTGGVASTLIVLANCVQTSFSGTSISSPISESENIDYAFELPTALPSQFFQVQPTHFGRFGPYTTNTTGLQARSTANNSACLKYFGNSLLRPPGWDTAVQGIGGAWNSRIIGLRGRDGRAELGPYFRQSDNNIFMGWGNLHFGLPSSHTFIGYGSGPPSWAFNVDHYIVFYLADGSSTRTYVGSTTGVTAIYLNFFTYSTSLSLSGVTIPTAAYGFVVDSTIDTSSLDPLDPFNSTYAVQYVAPALISPTMPLSVTRDCLTDSSIIPGRLWLVS